MGYAMQTKSTGDDPSLVARLARGDMHAFDDLVLAYQQRIINLAFRLLGDADAAQDIAQDVFVRAYQGAKNFRGDSQVYTWLYRITVNLVSNYRRKRKWEKVLSLFEPESRPMWPAGESSRPDTRLESKERRQLVQRALSMLPESQRTVLVLHRWEGMSYKEIAKVTGLSLAAVESRIHRGYKMLGKILPKLLEME